MERDGIEEMLSTEGLDNIEIRLLVEVAKLFKYGNFIAIYSSY